MKISSKLAVLILVIAVFCTIVVLTILSVVFPVSAETYVGFVIVTVTSSALTLVATIVAQALSESQIREREERTERRLNREKQRTGMMAPLAITLENIRDKMLRFLRVPEWAQKKTASELMASPEIQNPFDIEATLRGFLSRTLALAPDPLFRMDLLMFNSYVGLLESSWRKAISWIRANETKRAVTIFDLCKKAAEILLDAALHYRDFCVDFLNAASDEPVPDYGVFLSDRGQEKLEAILDQLGAIAWPAQIGQQT